MPTLLTKEQVNYIRENIDLFPDNKTLGRKFNLTRKQMADFLYYKGIRRSYSIQGKVFYNENFFLKYNKLSCYWAGFISADGCISIRPNGKDKFLTINLQEKDKIHLENFIKHILGKNVNIIKRKVKNKYTYYSVLLYNNKITNDLQNNFYIYPRKTLNLKLPPVPDKYIIDYIRGYVDGDGCITVSKDKSVLKIGFSYVGNKEFLKKIAEIIGIDFYFYTYDNKLYQVAYSKYNSIRAIQKIYLPMKKFCLERKRKKYLYYMNNITMIQRNRMKAKGLTVII